MIRVLIAILMLFFTVPAWAEFTSSNWTAMTTNGGFESAVGSEWTCTGCTGTGRVTSPVYAGTYSYNLKGTNAVLKQTLSLTANTAYNFTAHVRDNSASAGLTLKIVTTGQEEQAVTPISNPSFENSIASEWSCNVPGSAGYEGCGASSTWRTTSPVQHGTYALKATSVWDLEIDEEYEAWWGRKYSQNITIEANTQYTIKAYVRDNTASHGVSMWIDGSSSNCSVSDTPSNINTWTQLTCVIPSSNTATSKSINFAWTTFSGNGSDEFYVDNITVTKLAQTTVDVCSSTDTPSNINTWTQLTCLVPVTNSVTNPEIRIVSPDNTNQFYVDRVQQMGENGLTVRLPAGSADRRVKLYSSIGRVYKDTLVDSNGLINYSAGSVADGSYYWYITDIDGKTFVDNTNFISMTPSTESKVWTWTNSNLTKDIASDLVLRGDPDQDGNCLNNGSTGCYHVITRGGTDYAYLGPALGSNLAAGATVIVSSGTGAANLNDGNVNTYWQAGSSSANEYACIVFDSTKTFNRVIIRARSESNDDVYLGATVSVRVSPTDTGCEAGDFTAVTGATYTKGTKELRLSIPFSAQTKRYLRVNIDSGIGTPHKLWEIEVYNEDPSTNPASDIDFLVIRRESDTATINTDGVRYDSYVTESDGSKTFTKTYSGYGTVKVNYKKVGDTWRRKFTVNMTAQSDMTISNTIMRYVSTSVPCIAAKPFSTRNTESSGVPANVNSCSTFAGSTSSNGYSLTTMPPVWAIGFPEYTTLTSDSGCKAKYSSFGAITVDADLATIHSEENWVKVSSTYGVTADNKNPKFILLAGKDYEFISALRVAGTPDGDDAVAAGITSLADSYDKTGFDEIDKLLWSSAMYRVNINSNQDVCVALMQHDYSGWRVHWHDSNFIAIALNDSAIYRDMVYVWRRGGAWCGPDCGINTPGNAYNATPSFVSSSPYPTSTAFFLGYGYRRGWITVTADCSDTDRTCIKTSERDELYTYINNQIPSNGEIFSGLCALTWSTNLCNNQDVTAAMQGEFYIAYLSLQEMGVNVDQSKLNALKSNYINLFDSTDGYMHATKYGAWRTISDPSASGGAYRHAEPDWYAPSTARFVVPSGHSGSTAKFTVKKGADRGYLQVKKNGAAISGSPFDLYMDSWNTISSNAISMNSSGGILYGNIHNTSQAIMYKNVTPFSGLKRKITMRVRSLPTGPTGVNVAFYENEDCFGHDGNCYQSFGGVITADGNWQTITLNMTDPQWEDSDNIIHLRFDFYGGSATGNLLEIDWIKVAESDGSNEITIDDFTVDGPFAEVTLSETVSTGDVLLFQLRDTAVTKNASSSYYYVNLDKVTIGATSYEAEDSSAFQCGDFPFDCKDGYSLGWKRWKSPRFLLWEFISRAFFGISNLTDEQVRSHYEKMPATSQGYGSLMGYIATERGFPIPTVAGASEVKSYWGQFDAGNDNHYTQYNGASFLIWDGLAWSSLSGLGDSTLWYSWDDKSDIVKKTGTWTKEFNTGYVSTNEHGTSKYFNKSVWASSTTGSTIEVKGIPYTDLELYLVTGSSQGSVKVYFDNAGGGYDSGTTVDLTAGSGNNDTATKVFEQTGLSYSPLHKFKIEVLSGVVMFDFFKTKIKPSTLLELRVDEEFLLRKSVKNYVASNYDSQIYRSSISYSDWAGMDLFYTGKPLQAIKRKINIFLKGLFNRRMPQ